MGVASLVLGIFSIVLGVLPLLPLSGPASLVLAALGVPLGVLGVCLGLLSRSEALHSQRALGLHTAGLSVAVVGALVCTTWVGGMFYAQRKFQQAALSCQQDPRQCPGFRAQRVTPPAAPVPAPGPTAL